MATLVLTNTRAAQALPGQGVRVTLSWSEANANIPLIEEGMRCTVGSIEGYVSEVDKLGLSFKATPAMPTRAFQSTAGYLMNGQNVTVYTT